MKWTKKILAYLVRLYTFSSGSVHSGQGIKLDDTVIYVGFIFLIRNEITFHLKRAVICSFPLLISLPDLRFL
jgi:hypothetical protein